VIPLLVLAASIQSTIIPLMKVGGAKPDLVLLMVISWSLLRGSRDGLGWGFIGGLCLDVLSGGPLGASSIALMVASLLSGQGETNIYKGNLLLPIILAVLGTLVYCGILLVVLELTGRPVSLIASISQVILPAAVMNMVAMPFVYALMRWLDQRTERPSTHW
jgi:rod shape-determining protein MreD